MNVITPLECYELNNDNRVLIPVYKSGKVGFINHDGVVVVPPKYDYYRGEFYSEDDLVVIANNYHYAYERKTMAPAVYERPLYGLLNSRGEEVLKPDYYFLSSSDNYRLFSVQNRDGKYGVVDKCGNVVIPFGTYSKISPFYRGLARVRSVDMEDNKNLWGIINEAGEIVLPIEYDDIWNFYNERNITLVKDSSKTKITVDSLLLPF